MDWSLKLLFSRIYRNLKIYLNNWKVFKSTQQKNYMKLSLFELWKSIILFYYFLFFFFFGFLHILAFYLLLLSISFYYGWLYADMDAMEKRINKSRKIVIHNHMPMRALENKKKTWLKLWLFWLSLRICIHTNKNFFIFFTLAIIR